MRLPEVLAHTGGYFQGKVWSSEDPLQTLGGIRVPAAFS